MSSFIPFQWHRGAWHGRGTLTHMSGAKYTGYFDKGDQHGTGEFVDVDGVRWDGVLWVGDGTRSEE